MTKMEQMFGLIESWQSSGLSKRVYAEQHNLKYATFQYWCKRYLEVHGGTGTLAGFVDLGTAKHHYS